MMTPGMKLHQPKASILVPDDLPLDQALARITHVGIGAHPDDLEIMALHGILAARSLRGFGGIVCAHGGEASQEVRRREQEEAARLGRYGVLFQLEYNSVELKSPAIRALEEDLALLFGAVPPGVVYTHNPADRHETHVAVALAVLRVLRCLPPDRQPKTVYGVEVWGSLDWLTGAARAELDVSEGKKLAAELIYVFRSQILSGKRYDLATSGRRRANATFANPHAPDFARELCLAMDLTPLVRDPALEMAAYVADRIEEFKQEAVDRVRRFAAPPE